MMIELWLLKLGGQSKYWNWDERKWVNMCPACLNPNGQDARGMETKLTREKWDCHVERAELTVEP
jgi:hypothetical protein